MYIKELVNQLKMNGVEPPKTINDIIDCLEKDNIEPLLYTASSVIQNLVNYPFYRENKDIYYFKTVEDQEEIEVILIISMMRAFRCFAKNLSKVYDCNIDEFINMLRIRIKNDSTYEVKMVIRNQEMRRRYIDQFTDDPEKTIKTPDTTSQIVVSIDIMSRYNMFLNLLKPKERQLFTSLYGEIQFDGISYQHDYERKSIVDIAATMGMPESTVRYHRNRLKSQFEEFVLSKAS